MASNESPSSEFNTFSAAGSDGSPAEKVPSPEIPGYTIVSSLGQGGMGTVWKAIQDSTQQTVALKVTHRHILSSQRAQSRFGREVALAARLSHPHIARVYDSGVNQTQCYYVMEFVDGVPLDRYIRDQELDVRERITLLVTICEALQYAHQKGVIHRDLKPSNILIDENKQPHLLDFGLAKDLLEGQANQSLSLEGDLLGTPAYMSPEQAVGKHHDVDVRSDIYTLGVILYIILTDKFPYEVNGPIFDTLLAVRETEPSPLRPLMSRWDSDLAAITMKTLAKDPDGRYQTIAELRYDLQSWQEGRPLVIKSQGTWYVLRKMMAKHQYTTTVVVLLIVIVLGFLVTYVHLYGRLNETHQRLTQSRDALIAQAQNYADMGQHVLLVYHFLPLWQQDKLDEARKLASYFSLNSPEAIASEFLLNPKHGDEKKEGLEKALSVQEDAFKAFILGEQYFKEGALTTARSAYQRSLNTLTESDQDRWLLQHVQSRLYELEVNE